MDYQNKNFQNIYLIKTQKYNQHLEHFVNMKSFRNKLWQISTKFLKMENHLENLKVPKKEHKINKNIIMITSKELIK